MEDPTFSERKCFFSDVLDKSLQLPKPKESSMYHLMKMFDIFRSGTCFLTSDTTLGYISIGKLSFY